MRFLLQNKWLLAAILFGLTASQCKAAWFDAAWQYRRAIQITWDDQHPNGEDLASCVFYTDGHALPNGEDIRVATEGGKLVASHVLMVGPGDRMRVVFSMQKNVRTYEIYFGNSNPAPPPPGMDDVHYKSGILIETRIWTGGVINNFAQIEKSWDRSKPVLGKMMVDGVFLGYNPFGPQEQWISKFQGSLFAPIDGDYQFAVAADDKGALYIDGQPTVFADLGPGDTRYHGTAHLTRGRHDLMAYHINMGGEAYISVGWKQPQSPKFEIINRESFGICYSGLVGPMEQHEKTLIADFSATQTGECFANNSYSFCYHFISKAKVGVPIKLHWDFGDGQTSDQKELDHVYLFDGTYTIKLIATAGPNSDTQTCKLAVERNYAHILDVHEDSPQILSTILQSYDLSAIPNDNFPRLLQLHLAADQLNAAVKIAEKLSSQKNHSDPVAILAMLTTLQKKLIDAGQPEQTVTVWDRVPTDSDLQPTAARHGAELALYWTGDFAKAVAFLKPYQNRSDPQLRRCYGQALLLSGDAEHGKEILEEIKSTVAANRKAALSGAAARSVEFFITSNDPEPGEEAWDRWQQKFPADFLEGYSVVLRTRLMELRKRPDAAAKLAEAFAIAQPRSPYAPQLLDQASKLVATTDPAKSQALHQLLKQKYPEDPLSQQ